RWPEATRSAKGGSPTAGRNPPPSSISKLLPPKCPGQTAPRASEERVETPARLGADGTVWVNHRGSWGVPEHFLPLSDHSCGDSLSIVVAQTSLRLQENLSPPTHHHSEVLYTNYTNLRSPDGVAALPALIEA